MKLNSATSPQGNGRSGDRQALAGRAWPWARLVGGAILIATLLLGVPPWQQVCLGGASPRVEHDQLKAVFLYNFLHFVTWPADYKVPGQASAMVIGVVGDSPVRQALTELSAELSQMDKGSLRVVDFGSYQEAMDLSACHVLFVSNSERAHMEKIIASLGHVPVLTVADTEAFLAAGGMITLLEQQNRIRYHINRKAATGVDLRLSSQLLKTAIKVQDE